MSLRSILTGAVVALGVAASVASATAETVRMAVTDVAGLEQLRREWSAFTEKMKDYTGYTIEFAPVTSRTAAVELLRSENVDLVLTGPAEYVVINKLTEAKPLLGFSRPDYFSGIIVMADSGITAVSQLEGKKVAMGDIGSTSSHLGPSAVLADYGIDPTQDIEVIHTADKIGYESLKRGDVAAWGTNYMSDFVPLRAAETALSPGAFRVIARGPDLPNDILMVGAHVSDEIAETIRAAVVEHSDDLIHAIVAEGGEENQKYDGMQFIAEVKDSDYDYIRKAYATIGHPEFGEFVGD
jgi:phosphonate transport system substrate-binding protein